MPTFTNNVTPGNEHAIVGVADKGIGVHGTSNTSTGTGGVSGSGIGVHGVSTAGPGVRGDAENGVGVFGGSKTSSGVGGMTESGIGVHGVSKTGVGVRGDCETFQGVYGHSETGEGIHGDTNSPTMAAIAGFNLNPSGTGAAIYGEKQGNVGHAGFFKGNVEVTGNIEVTGPGSDIRLTNADCAEDFDVSGANKVEPGTVMVLGEEGALTESQQAYDKRVAGVISGAGDYKPAIVLDVRMTMGNRQPIALMGKVFCKVDAQFGAIEVGDLLTTSPTPGHAMAVSEPGRAFGTIIGKALRPLLSGKDLIPILVALK